MVYVELILELPRNKVREAWQVYQDKVMQYDKECVEKVGGRFVGYWYTEYGRLGEITILHAYPSLDAREEVLEMIWQSQDEEFRKGLAEWAAYVPMATAKVLRPLPSSPLD